MTAREYLLAIMIVTAALGKDSSPEDFIHAAFRTKALILSAQSKGALEGTDGKVAGVLARVAINGIPGN
jgi:hypothetical protein